MTTPAGDAGTLADNIAYFGRALRKAGLKVGPSAVQDAVRAVEATGFGRKEDFYWTLHALFVKRREDREVFDQAFRLFWRRRALMEKMMQMLMPVAPGRPEDAARNQVSRRVADAIMPRQREEEAPKRTETEIDMRLTLSDREVLQRKDFAQMSAAELDEAKRAIRELVMPADTIRTRRLKPSGRGHLIDLRATMRASMKAGGGIIGLKRRARAVKRPPVVAILDISGSMSEYSRIMLHFLHALSAVREVHSFLFGTRFTNVTRALRARDPDAALAACSAMVEDWSGGTRIASSLHVFNRYWSRRVLGQGATVLLVTDGLEREEGGQLAFEVDRLHRSCRRLVWLNPLLRFDGFEPRAAGIRAMLPHVDEFRTVHNLNAIADICRALAGETGRRRAA
ncbi:MAG: VWA domain-containing protein [Flavobacteriaceae bacterium]